ncbi:MAG: hypothetical protein FJZ85_00365 [Chloroflexi bacterium]|nr:hypothetical protein [Chloroflexota bacterium]
MKRMFSMLLATMLMAASLGFAPAVLADNASAEADVNVAGIGKLSAQGDGIAVLSGKGIIDLSGNGILWVKDFNGDAKGQGTRQSPALGSWNLHHKRQAGPVGKQLLR